MVSEESGEATGHDSADSLIDELISDILSEAGQSAKARVGGGDSMARLIETAFASAASTTPRAPTIERLLLAQALASSLADALAPALAEVLAPEILKALEHQMTGDQSPEEPTSATTSTRGRKKT